MAFQGNTSPFLVEGGAVAVQSAQLGWDVLDAFHALPHHEPWLYDASAMAMAVAVWNKLPGTTLFKCLPSVFVAMNLFQCVCKHKCFLAKMFYQNIGPSSVHVFHMY
jgi:hypothetical protein